MTGIIRIGVTERGSFKKNIRKRRTSRSSKGVQNLKLPLTLLRIYRAYAEST